MSEITSYKLACVIARILDEKLGKDITILNISNVSSFADYFVIATAKNVRHAASLANDLIDAAHKAGYDVRFREGEDNSSWILVDLYTVVVHIFTEDARAQYRLENLWSDLPMEHYTDIKD